MSKGDVAGVIGAEARAADRDAVTIALAPGEIEYVAHDHAFVDVVRPYPISRMDRFVIETFQIDGVRAINGEVTCIDMAAHRAN